MAANYGKDEVEEKSKGVDRVVRCRFIDKRRRPKRQWPSLGESREDEDFQTSKDHVTNVKDDMSGAQKEKTIFGGFQVNLKEWEENIDEYVSTHYSEDAVDLKLEYQKSLWETFDDDEDGQCSNGHVASQRDILDVQMGGHIFKINLKEWEENIDEYVSTHYSEDAVDLKLEYQKSLWETFDNEDGQCSSDHVAGEGAMSDVLNGGHNEDGQCNSNHAAVSAVQTGSHIFEINLKDWEENIDEYVSTHYSEDAVDLKLEYQKSLCDSFDNEDGQCSSDHVAGEIMSDVQNSGHNEDGQCSSNHVAGESVVSDVPNGGHNSGDFEVNLKEWEENITEHVSTHYSEDEVDLKLVDQKWGKSCDAQQEERDLNTDDVKNAANIQNGRQLLADVKESCTRKAYFSPQKKALFRSRFTHHQIVGDISEENSGKVSDEENDEGEGEKEKKSRKTGRKTILQRMRNLFCCTRRQE